MSDSRWDRIASVFLDALDLEPDERASFVENACPDDTALRCEVVAMLEAHEGGRPLGIERRFVASDDAVTRTDALEVGTRVGAYRIVDLVGEGGMGQVYRAERADGGYEQIVAVKVLRPGYLAAEAVRRFRVERQVLARLVHPGIAAILDGGTLPDGRPYLVLQFVDGVPITSYCDERGLDVDERLRLFCRVTEAVQFAHGQLVVHRDLKPSNILVTADGAPCLLDFGIAKLLDPWLDDSLVVATRSDVRLLTPGHAAPEQLRGEPVGVATDVYGLGVLLFELLTGRRPFLSTGRTATELETAILSEPAPLPSSVVPRARARKLAGDVDRIVLMALRKEPARRYATVAQMADDVERFLGGWPVQAHRDTLAYRARKFVARNRTLVTAASLAALLVGGFGVTSTVQARRIAEERDRAEQERVAAEDVVTLLSNLFERANPAIVPGGDTVRVAALLADGERRVDSLVAHPDRQARMWRVLGNMYYSRGEYARAESLLRRSWTAQRRMRPDDAETARTYHELAEVVKSYRGATAAEPMLDTSLAELRRVLGARHPDIAKAIQSRASVAAAPGEQRRLLDQAGELWRQLPDTDSVAVAGLLNDRGSESFARGAYAEARSFFEASLRILEPRAAPGHPNRLAVTRNLSAVLSGLGEWAAAESLSREVVALAPSSVRGITRAHDLEQLALLAANMGRLDDAEAGLRASVAALRTEVAGDHWRIDNTLRNLGLVVVARGRVVEGLAILDSAVVRTRQRNGAAAPGYGYLVGQRVMPLLRLGRLADARAALRTSERLLAATVPVKHQYRADLGWWRAEVALAEGDAGRAEAELRATLDARSAQLPASHPKVAGAACLLGAAVVRQGRPGDAPADLVERCRTYEGWGLADPLAVAWGREALAAVRR